MDELLLDGACARDMHFIRVLHMAGDFLEELALQGSLLVLHGVLAGITARTRFAGMAQNGKFLRGGVGVADDRGVMRVHPYAELLFVFY